MADNETESFYGRSMNDGENDTSNDTYSHAFGSKGEGYKSTGFTHPTSTDSNKSNHESKSTGTISNENKPTTSSNEGNNETENSTTNAPSISESNTTSTTSEVGTDTEEKPEGKKKRNHVKVDSAWHNNYVNNGKTKSEARYISAQNYNKAVDAYNAGTGEDPGEYNPNNSYSSKGRSRLSKAFDSFKESNEPKEDVKTDKSVLNSYTGKVEPTPVTPKMTDALAEQRNKDIQNSQEYQEAVAARDKAINESEELKKQVDQAEKVLDTEEQNYYTARDKLLKNNLAQTKEEYEANPDKYDGYINDNAKGEPLYVSAPDNEAPIKALFDDANKALDRWEETQKLAEDATKRYADKVEEMKAYQDKIDNPELSASAASVTAVTTMNDNLIESGKLTEEQAEYVKASNEELKSAYTAMDEANKNTEGPVDEQVKNRVATTENFVASIAKTEQYLKDMKSYNVLDEQSYVDYMASVADMKNLALQSLYGAKADLTSLDKENQAKAEAIKNDPNATFEQKVVADRYLNKTAEIYRGAERFDTDQADRAIAQSDKVDTMINNLTASAAQSYAARYAVNGDREQFRSAINSLANKSGRDVSDIEKQAAQNTMEKTDDSLTSQFKDWLSAKTQGIRTGFNELKSDVANSAFGKWASGVVQDVKNWAVNNPVSKWTTETLKGAGNWISSKYNALSDQGKAWVDSCTGFVTDVLKAGWNAGKNLVQGNIVGAIGSGIGGVIDEVANLAGFATAGYLKVQNKLNTAQEYANATLTGKLTKDSLSDENIDKTALAINGNMYRNLVKGTNEIVGGLSLGMLGQGESGVVLAGKGVVDLFNSSPNRLPDAVVDEAAEILNSLGASNNEIPVEEANNSDNESTVNKSETKTKKKRYDTELDRYTGQAMNEDNPEGFNEGRGSEEDYTEMLKNLYSQNPELYKKYVEGMK